MEEDLERLMPYFILTYEFISPLWLVRNPTDFNIDRLLELNDIWSLNYKSAIHINDEQTIDRLVKVVVDAGISCRAISDNKYGWICMGVIDPEALRKNGE
jgi:hypothetical protein